MTSFIEVIREGRTGLVFANSLFLPFHFELISIWIGKEMSLLAKPEIIVDLGENSQDVVLREGATYTNIVLRRYRDLAHEFGNGKGHVILYAAEKGSDIFRPENRHYIRISLQKPHKEITFELIEDPYQL
ncbi:MAG TPA: hypothetical protein VN367_02225 [Chlorobaculum sp.]|nr:hypothetical protein [Chlorobaculum sp.]